MLKRLSYAGAALLLMVGCSKKIEVQSDGCWIGNLNGGSAEGCGIKTYSLKGHEPCYTFQRTTGGTYLRVEVKRGRGDNPYTDAPGGIVTGCIK